MDQSKKTLIVIVIDILLLVAIGFSVWKLVFFDTTGILKNVCLVAIVVLIPVIFFITYMNFAGDRFDFDEEEYERLFGDDSDEEENSNLEK